jgi:CsoR family transcriptional regulator, copper-sensing transcriptional repressor
MASGKKPQAQAAEQIGYLEDEAQKALVDRLSRLEGHVRSIKRMIEDRRCADEILLQVAAVKAALNQFATAMVDHELKACLQSCMDGHAEERIDRVVKVLSTLLKQS